MPIAQTPIRIDMTADGDRQIVMRLKDDEPFVRTGRQVVADCERGANLDMWFNEVGDLLNHVSKWSAEHGEHVRCCVVQPGRGRINLWFIPHGESFDFELADELAQLSTRIYRDWSLVPVEALQVASYAWDRFFSLDISRVLYGDLPAAS